MIVLVALDDGRELQETRGSKSPSRLSSSAPNPTPAARVTVGALVFTCPVCLTDSDDGYCACCGAQLVGGIALRAAA